MHIRNRTTHTHERSPKTPRFAAASALSAAVRTFLALCMAVSFTTFVPLQPAYASGTAYYVSTSGNDANAGTQASPWRTIQKAANTVAGGSTVHVAPGTYNERVTISSARSGVSGAPTSFVADGSGVVVSQGFVVNSNYTNLTGFEIVGGYSQASEFMGQVHVTGSNDVFSGFKLYNLAGRSSSNVTSGFSFTPAASYDTVTNFTIDGVAGSGIVLSDGERGAGTYAYTSANTHLYGANHVTITNGSILHWKGRVGINAYGDSHLIQNVVFTGGPSGSTPGIDGDGIRVNYSTGTIIRNVTIHDLWEWYDDAQHTDCIQMYIEVYGLVVENSVLGTWEPGPAPAQRGGLAQEIGPSQIFMVGTVYANSHVNFEVRNSLLLGQTGTGASIVTAKQSGAQINVKLINNTFWTAYPGLNSVDTAYLRNNIFRAFYLYPVNLPGIDSDYNIFTWTTGSGSNNVPSGEGSHSLGKTYSTAVNPVALFGSNPDLTSATDWGMKADFRPDASSPAVGAGLATVAPATDLSGATRTPTADIGAYEYIGSTPVPTPDTTAPSVSITSPTSGSTVSGSVAVNATASDNVGVTGVEFRADGVLLGTDTTAPYSATWNASSAAAGSHTLTAKAVDAAGNGTTGSTNVTIADTTTTTTTPPPADTTAPSVSITSPTSGSTVSGSVAVNATASDNVGVTGVEFRADGVLLGTDTTAPYSATWNASSAAAGSHTLTAKAVDAAGNGTTASTSVSIADTTTTTTTVPPTTGPDTTAPSAPVVTSPTNPVGTVSTSSNAWFDYTASDNVGVAGFSTAFDQNAASAPDAVIDDTDGSSSFVADRDGVWYFHVRAIDAAGNAGPTTHYQITVNTGTTTSLVQPTLQESATDTSISGSKYVTIRGTYAVNGVAGAATNPVTVYSNASGTMQPIGTAIYNSAYKRYEFKTYVTKSQTYQMACNADVLHAAATSNLVTVSVRKASLALSRTTLALGSSTTAHVSVQAPVASHTVLKRWRYSTRLHRWVAKTSVSLRVASLAKLSAHMIASVSLPMRGHWRLRAVHTANGITTSSRLVYVTVK